MVKKQLESIARTTAKSLKTDKALNNFSQMLTKITAEAAINAELDGNLRHSEQPLITSRVKTLSPTTDRFNPFKNRSYT